MISIPMYDAIEALPHPYTQPELHSRPLSVPVQKKVGKFQAMCRTVGTMVSVPLCDAVEIYGP